MHLRGWEDPTQKPVWRGTVQDSSPEMSQQKHPSFPTPADPNVAIWRYQDFTKFVSMLEHGGLFFCRADRLGDPFEASYSRVNEQRLRAIQETTEIPAKAFRTIREFYRWVRQWTMVNCWHVNEHESAAMWRLYAKSDEAVAIRSTYARLRGCFENDVLIGLVRYIDYDRDVLPEASWFDLVMHKRKSFEHERELRAVWSKLPENHKGIDMSATATEAGVWKKVCLSELTDRVHVAPGAASWLKDLVQRVCITYGLHKPVIQSSLDDEPLF